MNLLEKEEWTEQDILELIETRAEENIHLDFKASGALSKSDMIKKDISKDVSAFANSDGGIIIYGITEKDEHVAAAVDHINGNEFTKEWLENIIIANIQRTIQGLKIFPVRFENNISKTVYVVRIPPSLDAPHINRDKKYYRRYDFQSVPMEEYEIRNLYNRRNAGIVEYSNIEIELQNGKTFLDDKYFDFELCLYVRNAGSALADLYKMISVVPAYAGVGMNYNHTNDYSLIKTYDCLIISNNKFVPLFPNEEICLLVFNMKYPLNPPEKLKGLDDMTINVLCGSNRTQIGVNIKVHMLELIDKVYAEY
ncbi:MAG: ATP-binding protein [Taibaiella sp.]|jgi:hypothetical protein